MATVTKARRDWLREARERLEKEHPVGRYARKLALPHTLCPGCGAGTVMSVFLHAVDELVKEGKLDPRKLVVVSGIGCTGRLAGFMGFDSMHTTHGRPVAFAMGVKLANPELKVIVISGDADLLSIGLNHTLQAARRNIDITVIMVNNFNIAMSGGEPTVTTPEGSRTKYVPGGRSIEKPFNVPLLLKTAGASYVARWTTFHLIQLKNSIKEAIMHRGFAFIEVVSQCPVLYGRYNNFREPWAMVEYFARNSKPVRNPEKEIFEASIEFGKPILVGVFHREEKPEFTERVYKAHGLVEEG